MSKVLIIGSGAREHVITELINKSSEVNSIYIIPSNSNTNLIVSQKVELIRNIDINSHEMIYEFELSLHT